MLGLCVRVAGVAGPGLVVLATFFDSDPGFLEEFALEQFVTNLRVEALAIAISQECRA